jgi:hypothetical protein
MVDDLVTQAGGIADVAFDASRGGCHPVQNRTVVTTSNTAPIGRSTTKWLLSRGMSDPARPGG